MNKPFFKRLAVKVVFTTLLVLVTLLSIQVFFTTEQLRDNLVDTYAQNTYNISEIVKNSTRYSMLLNLKSDVNQILMNIGENRDIKNIRIFDKLGYVRYSSDSTELGRLVEMESEMCQKCHTTTIPLEKLSLDDRTQFQDTPGGKELLLLNPIENEPSCYNNTDCHAHSKNDVILGIMEVTIPITEIDTIVDENVAAVLRNSLVGTIIIALLLGFLITAVINKPLRKIMTGINKFAGGEFKHKINVSSKDELGEVAHLMNNMAFRLDEAYNEIKAWNRMLNRKIEQKTEELKALYDQIIQVEKLASLGKLSATVAHELNNPLAGILTYSKLISKQLKKKQVDNEYANMLEYLTLISDESERCGKIVKDLLLFSHRSDDEFVPNDFKAIIDKSVLLINHHLEINDITLEKTYTEDDVMIMCNPSKIQQALMSLMINAIESMQGSGRLALSLKKEGKYGVLKIKDQGYGISEKDLPHIFEPFYTTKDNDKGTGLGLSVVYGIINSHKGKVEVEETSAEGTTFRIAIPLAAESEE